MDCLLIGRAFSAVEPSDDSLQLSVEVLRVVLEYGLRVELGHESLPVVLALKKIHQIFLIKGLVFWILLLYGIEVVA